MTVVTIQNDALPLDIVDPAYFLITGNAQLTEVDGQAEGTAFVGMADQEDQGKSSRRGRRTNMMIIMI